MAPIIMKNSFLFLSAFEIMYLRKWSVFFLPILLLFSLNGWAQTTVTGKVSDLKSEILPGVTVSFKNSSKGSVNTDANGSYNIAISTADHPCILFCGLDNKRSCLSGNRKLINVILESASSVLNDVVVTDCSIVTIKDLTGAVSTISFIYCVRCK